MQTVGIIQEAGSDEVVSWVDEADIVATCRVASPEAMSAFTRRLNRREIPRDRCHLERLPTPGGPR